MALQKVVSTCCVRYLTFQVKCKVQHPNVNFLTASLFLKGVLKSAFSYIKLFVVPFLR
jgi:hypothetical protein